MNWKYVFSILVVLIGYDFVSPQLIPSTTTAAELWNPWTWFWPYAIASAESFRDYYQKAQQATNDLYQQAYKTNAFPWLTSNGKGNSSQSGQGSGNAQPGGQSNEGGSAGQTQGGTGGQTQGGTGGQTDSGGAAEQTGKVETGQQTNQEETGGQTTQDGSNSPSEKPAQEEETQTEGTGTQIQGSVNEDGTGNAEVNKKI